MKLQGKTIEPPKPLAIPVSRDGKSLGLLAGPVLSFKPFEDMCPIPEPPTQFDVKTGIRIKLPKDPAFAKSLDKWSERKTNWMILTSLAATPDLKWENVNMLKPETWDNFRSEMEVSFTSHEVDKIIGRIFEANLPSDERSAEASGLFIDTSMDQGQEASKSQTEEPDSTPSGEPVKDLESSPQT